MLSNQWWSQGHNSDHEALHCLVAEAKNTFSVFKRMMWLACWKGFHASLQHRVPWLWDCRLGRCVSLTVNRAASLSSSYEVLSSRLLLRNTVCVALINLFLIDVIMRICCCRYITCIIISTSVIVSLTTSITCGAQILLMIYTRR